MKLITRLKTDLAEARRAHQYNKIRVLYVVYIDCVRLCRMNTKDNLPDDSFCKNVIQSHIDSVDSMIKSDQKATDSKLLKYERDLLQTYMEAPINEQEQPT